MCQDSQEDSFSNGKFLRNPKDRKEEGLSEALKDWDRYAAAN